MSLKKLIARFVLKLSVIGAGMPSLYGSYEPEVPENLRKKPKRTSGNADIPM